VRFQAARERLAEALRRGSLPGPRAHARLAPRPRAGGLRGEPLGQERPAAALVLLFPKGEEAFLLLTVRTEELARHGGQVSLPGGLVDGGETIEAAALREAGEEIGVAADTVELLGRLSPVSIPSSGVLLHPVVGAARIALAVRPSPREVARVLEAPLRNLLEPNRLRVERRVIRGIETEVPYFEVEGEKVWGATAMILSELVALLDPPPGD